MRSTFKEVVGELITSENGFFDLLERLKDSLHPIVAVGDTTTLNLVEGGVVPDLSIVDLGTRRGLLDPSDLGRMETFLLASEVIGVRNPQEEITIDLWAVIQRFFKDYSARDRKTGGIGGSLDGSEQAEDSRSTAYTYNKFKIGRPGRMGTTPLIIRIEGEEDLASLPCIYFSDDGGHVLYGLPDTGLVHIQVDEKHRTIVRNALIKMEAFA